MCAVSGKEDGGLGDFCRGERKLRSMFHQLGCVVVRSVLLEQQRGVVKL